MIVVTVFCHYHLQSVFTNVSFISITNVQMFLILITLNLESQKSWNQDVVSTGKADMEHLMWRIIFKFSSKLFFVEDCSCHNQSLPPQRAWIQQFGFRDLAVPKLFLKNLCMVRYCLTLLVVSFPCLSMACAYHDILWEVCQKNHLGVQCHSGVTESIDKIWASNTWRDHWTHRWSFDDTKILISPKLDNLDSCTIFDIYKSNCKA